MATLRVLLLSSENVAHKQAFFWVGFMYIYIIQAGRKGPYKIGVAKNVERRMSVLQTGNHKQLYIVAKFDFGSQKNALRAESTMHWIYRKNRIRGEWFNSQIRLEKADGYFKTNLAHQKKGLDREKRLIRESMRLDLELLKDKEMY